MKQKPINRSKLRSSAESKALNIIMSSAFSPDDIQAEGEAQAHETLKSLGFGFKSDDLETVVVFLLMQAMKNGRRYKNSLAGALEILDVSGLLEFDPPHKYRGETLFYRVQYSTILHAHQVILAAQSGACHDTDTLK